MSEGFQKKIAFRRGGAAIGACRVDARVQAGLAKPSSEGRRGSGRAALAGDDSGFALLLVFVLTASIAIMLYMEMPRLVVEQQRQKEQVLIDRGEQYQRAIQLFFRKNQRYPAKLEDLERFSNIRYLRKKYKDPMTESGEWRLIHVGPNGEFVDSLVYGPKKQDKDKDKQKAGTNTLITEGPAVGSTGATDANSNLTPALQRRRASDMAGAPGSVNMQGQGQVDGDPNAEPGQLAGVQPGQAGQLGYGPNQPQYPGAVAGVTPNPNQPGFNPNQPGVNPALGPNPLPGGMPGQRLPPTAINLPMGQPGTPGSPGFGQQGGSSQSSGSIGGYANPVGGGGVGGGYATGIGGGGQGQGQGTGNPTFGNQPGTGFPGQTQQGGAFPSSGGANPAADVIGKLLTSPRPGGLQGLQGSGGFGSQTGGGMQGQGGFGSPMGGGQMGGGLQGSSTFGNQSGSQMMGGGGIAGVASKSEDKGIKIYAEHQKYNEWEFVFDPRQSKGRSGGAGGVMNPNLQGQQGMNQGGANQQGGFNQGGFGGGFNSGSGFNSGGSSFGGQSSPGSGQQQPGFGQQQPGFGQDR